MAFALPRRKMGAMVWSIATLASVFVGIGIALVLSMHGTATDTQIAKQDIAAAFKDNETACAIQLDRYKLANIEYKNRPSYQTAVDAYNGAYHYAQALNLNPYPDAQALGKEIEKVAGEYAYVVASYAKAWPDPKTRQKVRRHAADLLAQAFDKSVAIKEFPDQPQRGPMIPVIRYLASDKR